jgi:hypothetical protein
MRLLNIATGGVSRKIEARARGLCNQRILRPAACHAGIQAQDKRCGNNLDQQIVLLAVNGQRAALQKQGVVVIVVTVTKEGLFPGKMKRRAVRGQAFFKPGKFGKWFCVMVHANLKSSLPDGALSLLFLLFKVRGGEPPRTNHITRCTSRPHWRPSSARRRRRPDRLHLNKH